MGSRGGLSKTCQSSQEGLLARKGLVKDLRFRKFIPGNPTSRQSFLPTTQPRPFGGVADLVLWGVFGRRERLYGRRLLVTTRRVGARAGPSGGKTWCDRCPHAARPSTGCRRLEQHDRVLDDVLELADVAGPGMGPQRRERLFAQARHGSVEAPVLAPIMHQEGRREQLDVRDAVP